MCLSFWVGQFMLFTSTSLQSLLSISSQKGNCYGIWWIAGDATKHNPDHQIHMYYSRNKNWVLGNSCLTREAGHGLPSTEPQTIAIPWGNRYRIHRVAADTTHHKSDHQVNKYYSRNENWVLGNSCIAREAGHGLPSIEPKNIAIPWRNGYWIHRVAASTTHNVIERRPWNPNLENQKQNSDVQWTVWITLRTCRPI